MLISQKLHFTHLCFIAQTNAHCIVHKLPSRVFLFRLFILSYLPLNMAYEKTEFFALLKGNNSMKYNATLNLIVAVSSVESAYKCVLHKSYIKVHSAPVKNFNRWNVRILWKPDFCPSNSRNLDKYQWISNLFVAMCSAQQGEKSGCNIII